MTWQSIPPAVPYFGGLWEANVKSFKSILKRIINYQVYTHEEFETLFCQIEAIMYSRPLCSMSMDSSDYSALTPGHFLIGESLFAVPSLDYVKSTHPVIVSSVGNYSSNNSMVLRLHQGLYLIY